MKALILITALLAAAPSHPWACYQGDAQHTGRSAFAVGDSFWTDWTFSAGGNISGSAVVNDQGRVLFGARDVHLYCLNPDGSVAWDANLESLGTSIYFSTPALDDAGNVYITTNRKLVKVDSTGTVVWAYPDHRSWSISHSPVIGAGGRIYFANYADSIFAVRPDGTLDWARDLGGDCNSTPAIGPDGRVYVATTRGEGNWKLWAFEAGGATAWSFDLAAQADFSTPTVGPDTTIYVGAGRYLYALRPDGSLRRRDSLSAAIQSSPAVANDSTLYVTAGSYLYRLSTESGVRWRKYLSGANNSAPAVDAAGRVFVGTANSDGPAVLAVAPDSTVLCSVPTVGLIWASPAIGADGRVFVGSMNGVFYAFVGTGLGVEEPVVRGRLPHFSVVPNPTAGQVRLVGSADIERLSIRAFDASGREVRHHRAGRELDLAGLPAGVYLLEARGPEGKARSRVVLR